MNHNLNPGVSYDYNRYRSVQATGSSRSLSNNTANKRSVPREYEFIPGAFKRTVLSSAEGETQSIKVGQGRSLISSREVKKALGFPGRVLAAVNMNGQTFWVMDVRDSVPITSRGHGKWTTYNYEVQHAGRGNVDLGKTGIVVVHPETWRSGFTNKSGVRALYDNPQSPSGIWKTVVSGSSKPTQLPFGPRLSPTRDSFDLRSSFPETDSGFVVAVTGDPFDHSRKSDVIEIGVVSDGNGEVRPEVLEALPRTPEGVLRQAIGHLTMRGIGIK